MLRASSHGALMRLRPLELLDYAYDNARKLHEPPPVTDGLDKRALAHLVMDQTKRLSAREARLGE